MDEITKRLIREEKREQRRAYWGCILRHLGKHDYTEKFNGGNGSVFICTRCSHPRVVTP